MKHEITMALHSYWQSCRGRTGVLASAIRAEELAPLLPSLFLIDRDVSTGFRFQYCGAAIATRYGRDLSDGAGFLALWNADDRGLLKTELRRASAPAAGVVMGVLGETAGGGFTFFEMLLLPLRSASGLAGAIGSMVRIGGHEETNRIRARLVGQTLRSVRFLSATGLPIGTACSEWGRAPPRGPSEIGRPTRHLTLLEGGKRGRPTTPPLTDP